MLFRWTLSPTGLKYDRLWMITSSNNVYLSLKTEPQLYLIMPQVFYQSLLYLAFRVVTTRLILVLFKIIILFYILDK